MSVAASRTPGGAEQRGMVLISAILLLLIITILAVSMFRSFGVQAKIASNVREKERALHAAQAAQQYAEWWLSNNAGLVAPATCSSVVNANTDAAGIQICSNTFPTALDSGSPAVVPWTIGGNDVGTQYRPENGTGTALMPIQNSNSGTPTAGTYGQAPMFYISYLGTCADGVGNCYQIDAVGYGGTTVTGNSQATVAVIESTYEVSAGVNNLGGP
jgi:type IV pilus assembly protein PilX